jgi:hypothetical protein
VARKLIVEILGDSKSLERSFTRSSAAAGKFGRDVDTVGGRLDKTTKRFTNLQTAFVGSIAFSAAAAGVRSVVLAAAEAQQVLGQTKVALEATGNSWARYGQQIQDTVQAQSKLGFDDEALLRTFSLFVRTTDDVSKSLRLNNLAMDVARARFIDLEQAALLVNKAAIGQAGALRRLGIDVKAGASAQELLTALTEKYGGAAKAAGKDASTAFDRAKVSIENAKEEIGGNLLPTVAGLSETLADTLDLFTQLGRTKIPPVHVPLVFDFGGSSVGDFAHKAVFTLPEFVNLTKKVVTDLINDFRDTTKVSTPELAREFTASLDSMFQSALDTAAANVKAPKVKLTPAIEFDKLPGVDTGGPIAASFGGAIDKFIKTAQAQAADKVRKGRAAISKAAADAAKADQRSAFDSIIAAIGLQVDQAAATKGLADDLRRNSQLQAAIRKQIGVEGKTTELASQLFQAQQARSAILEQQAQAAADARTKASAKIQKAAAEAQKAQFRALGLDATGSKAPPGIANLRKQLEQLSSRDDLTVNDKGILARIRKVLVDPVKKATPETRAAIKGLFDGIRQEFDKGTKTATGPLTKTSSLNATKLLDGLGLGRDMEKELRARLSNFNSAGVGLAGARRPTGGFSSQPVVIENHTTVQLDGETVGRSITKTQQKAKRRNPTQKRGPNSGV